MTPEEIQSIEHQLRKPKTKKGAKIVRQREPQVEEGPKKTLFVKGNKGSEKVNTFLNDFYQLKKQYSINYSNKHDIHPFEGTQMIDKFVTKNDCSLFVFGSHQKKRPDNIVIGRYFNNQLLDMVEFAIKNIKSIDEFNRETHIQIPANQRPVIIFQGDVFETQPAHMKIKNLLLDLFVENVEIKNIDLIQGLSHAVVVSANEENIFIKTFAIQIDQNIARKENISEDDKPLRVVEVGPSCDLSIRREKWATEEIYKMANRRHKVIKKKEKKNVSYDNVGDKTGRVFVDKQNLDVLALHKVYHKKQMSPILQQLDPVLKQLNFDDFDNIEPLRKISDKIGQGCRPAHIVFILLVFSVILLVLNLGSFIIGSLVGFLYPAYMSFKALESKESRDDKQWLTYWIIVSFMTVFDNLIQLVLYFIPAYQFFKVIFYVYLFHPKTRGAEQIYNSVLENFLTKYESTIDDLIKRAEGGFNKYKDDAKAKLN
ncbi:hypothetical protein PPERSA_07089 [Pseudocohnilembus persalinus]|uniref:Ribosome production factor 2 homolog n=1 Tax=Pseudocohnilembus persalinus TaxID=266149 RepID=A0A0V0QXI9_PSEPJ|nr:hypothetical protein PPERSA_07089 [Pseudocohnilembus persalinus]|eukprot:KRX06926.1 hypothetical protein PPERSA_07089 [Pseudocohnilembus persalinus]